MHQRPAQEQMNGDDPSRAISAGGESQSIVALSAHPVIPTEGHQWKMRDFITSKSFRLMQMTSSHACMRSVTMFMIIWNIS